MRLPASGVWPAKVAGRVSVSPDPLKIVFKCGGKPLFADGFRQMSPHYREIVCRRRLLNGRRFLPLLGYSEPSAKSFAKKTMDYARVLHVLLNYIGGDGARAFKRWRLAQLPGRATQRGMTARLGHRVHIDHLHSGDW